MAEEVGTTEDKKAPWSEEDFDAERAWTLVQNLREENRDLKAQMSDFHAIKAEVESLKTVVAQKDEALAEKTAELVQVSSRATKERLLAERGLPSNILGALSGETEDEWTQMADMLKSLAGSGENKGFSPDPVQSEAKAQPSGDAARLALAHKVFG